MKLPVLGSPDPLEMGKKSKVKVLLPPTGKV